MPGHENIQRLTPYLILAAFELSHLLIAAYDGVQVRSLGCEVGAVLCQRLKLLVTAARVHSLVLATHRGQRGLQLALAQPCIMGPT